MKINLLGSFIYNRISAGEVVENPQSVVKELVENAIDAGATKILVAIFDGGLREIVVEDNGIGIPKEELPKAILPHATSKISDASDLDAIKTLGFRGEALASIAAVSDIEIRSQYQNSDTRGILNVRNGIQSSSEGAASAASGTKITVSSLFYNTPARLKFLKKPRSEAALVSQQVHALALANPNVAFTYQIDGETVLKTNGEQFLDAIAAVYGKTVASNMMPLVEERDASHGILLSGYISSPKFPRHNRSLQTLIVNGRVVSDASFSASVQNAYGERLMQRNFPCFAISLTIPYENVDVNVHPNKREVRFQNPRAVYGAAYHAVRETLARAEQEERNALFANLTAHKIEGEPTKDEVVPTQEVVANNGVERASTLEQPPTLTFPTAKQNEWDDDTLSRLFDHTPNEHAVREQTSVMPPFFDYSSNLSSEKEGETQVSNQFPTKEEAETLLDDNKGFIYAGYAFTTYVILQAGDTLYFIDQHAAHERFLYDELVTQIDNRQVVSQQLLLPFILEDTPESHAKICELLPELNKIGFEVEPFGYCAIKVQAVPMLLSGIQLPAFFQTLAEKQRGKEMAVSDLAKDVLAKKACKAAIKAGDLLTDQQVEHLFSTFLKQNIPLQCPHGRPVYFTITKQELEKRFRRIV